MHALLCSGDCGAICSARLIAHLTLYFLSFPPACRYELPVTITPNQNLILRDINPSWKDDILSTLQVSTLTKWLD